MVLRRSLRVSVGTSNSTTRRSSSTSSPPTRRPQISSRRKGSRNAIDGDGARGIAGQTAPATPPSDRRRKIVSKTVAIPATPTPSNAKSMGTPYSLPTADGSRGKTLRVARPDRTNATLVSPETLRIVNAKTSPSKALPLSKAEVTTDNLLKTACNHLITVDPKLKAVIDKHPCPVFSPEGLAEKIDPFKSLTSGIIAQQVSGAAAKAIKTRFVALFNEDSSASEELVDSKFPHPSQVAACDETRLRSAGLSARKAEYIKGLSEKFVSGELSTEMLLEATDDEVMEKLIAVKGLGKWSVEMFACFALKRMDILSTGDLGVQRGMAAYVGKDVSKLKAKGGGKWKYMSEQDMLDISAKFSPYRSLFMWYMWRIEGVDVSAVQDN